MSEQVLLDVGDGVGTVTLNRPERRNAVTPGLLVELAAALDELEQRVDVAVVVLTGAGGVFCAGGDISTMRETAALAASPTGRPQAEAAQRTGHRGITARLAGMPKPTVAAIPGAVAGAGLAFALACDLRYAAASARFSTSFVRMALPGDYGVSWLLTQAVGPAKAKELLLLSDVVDAPTAERLGLINAVVADDELAARVGAVAGRLAAGPRAAYAQIKANVNLATTGSLDEALEREIISHQDAKASADHAAAIDAFLARRATADGSLSPRNSQATPTIQEL